LGELSIDHRQQSDVSVIERQDKMSPDLKTLWTATLWIWIHWGFLSLLFLICCQKAGFAIHWVTSYPWNLVIGI